MAEKYLADGKLYRIADIKPFPENYRRHPTRQVNLIRQGLREFKQYRNLIVWQHPETGVFHSLVGHAVIEAALQEGWTEIFAREYVGLSLAEARTLVAYDNQSALLAEDDQDDLSQLIAAVHAEDESLAALAAGGEDELRRLLEMAGQEPMGAPEAQIDKAAELQEKWQVKAGDVFVAGEQRLICGDCTDRATVERLMDGEKAALVVTSPPYAVGKEYEAETTFAEHLALLRDFADRCIEVVVPGGFIFVNFGEIAPQSHTHSLTGSNRQCIYPISKDYWQIFHEERGCDLYAQRIWYKPFNRLQQPFWSYHTSIPHYQEWEHIWTWRTPGGTEDKVHEWDISVHAVWDTRNEATDDRPLTRHVAAFPVCLPERALRAHSDRGDIVFDPFLGSGTTLVACARLGRRGRGIEIYAPYVSVALQRLQDMGLEVKRVEDGHSITSPP